MTTTPPPLLPDEQTKKFTFRPILITLLCSILLAGGSCFGFLQTSKVNQNAPVSNVFAVGFVAGVLLFLSGCVWAAVALFLHFFRTQKGDQLPSA